MSRIDHIMLKIVSTISSIKTENLTRIFELWHVVPCLTDIFVFFLKQNTTAENKEYSYKFRCYMYVFPLSLHTPPFLLGEEDIDVIFCFCLILLRSFTMYIQDTLFPFRLFFSKMHLAAILKYIYQLYSKVFMHQYHNIKISFSVLTFEGCIEINSVYIKSPTV